MSDSKEIQHPAFSHVEVLGVMRTETAHFPILMFTLRKELLDALNERMTNDLD